MTIMCRVCGKYESTGMLIELCDDCFEEFEEKVFSDPDKKFVPDDTELEYFSDDVVDRKKN